MEFDDILTALALAQTRFVITGGVAAVFHGYRRPVADLDLVVDLAAPDSGQRAAACLGTLGFVPTIPLPLNAVVVMRWLDQNGREVDLNVRYPISFADLETRSHAFPVGGHLVRVISLADLVSVKTARARDYDVTDVAALRELHRID